jgi:prepilin-type N-terminal cleavage/methylation domain-containing protein
MIKNKNRGFTLIELLVVIAIIGILASVVLISTNATRARGNDSAIQANLGTIKLQAELVNISNKCYGSDCTSTAAADTDCATIELLAGTLDPLLTKAFKAAESSSGDKDNIQCATTDENAAYAVAVPLKTDATKAWCVDSVGYADVIVTGALVEATASCE